MGPDGTGKINFATSFVAYFTLLASVGIPLYGIREVAKIRDDREALSALVQELLILHGMATAVSLLAYLGCLAWSPKVHAESLLFLIHRRGFYPPFHAHNGRLYQGLEEYVYITIRSLSFTEWKLGDEPYYPVNDEKNSMLYAKYKVLADAESQHLFGGRLADYKCSGKDAKSRCKDGRYL